MRRLSTLAVGLIATLAVSPRRPPPHPRSPPRKVSAVPTPGRHPARPPSPARRRSPADTPSPASTCPITRARSPGRASAGSGRKFTYSKATEGVTYVDPTYQANNTGAKQNGMYSGAYTFALPDRSTGAAQADWLLDHAPYVADGQTLPPMLDIEWPWNGSGSPSPCYGLTPAQMVAWIHSFVDRVFARTGQKTMIYTNTNWWNPCTGNSTAFADQPLFVASYSSSPGTLPAGWTSFRLWQYTSSETVPGISGGADGDVFNGTLQDLAALAGGTVIGPVAGRSVQARADVNGDGKADFVSMYDYGGFQTKLLVGLSTGSSVPAPAVWFDSGAGGWDWSRNKIAVADFTGDGKADVGALYDYGGLQAKLFVFRSTGTGFAAPALWWDSGVGGWDWSRSTMAVGDYNGDGKADLGVLYDYGSLRTKLLVGLSTGTSMPAPQAWWNSGTGGWDYARSKIATGDYNGDGKTDLGVLYDYGSLQTKLFVGLSTGNAVPAPQAWWNSGVGGWELERSKVTVGDYNGNGKGDLSASSHRLRQPADQAPRRAVHRQRDARPAGVVELRHRHVGLVPERGDGR